MEGLVHDATGALIWQALGYWTHSHPVCRSGQSAPVRGEPFRGVYPECIRRAQDRLVEPPGCPST